MPENFFTTTTAIPITSDDLKAAEPDKFFIWKKQMLRKIRLADIGIKILLILPFLLPSVVVWSVMHWLPGSNVSAPPRLSFWAEIFLSTLVFLVFLSFPLMQIFIELGKLSKIQKKKKLRDIDWSEKKFQGVADAVTEAGIDISKTYGKLEFADRLDVHIYNRSRTFRKATLLLFIVWFLLQVFRPAPVFIFASFVIIIVIPFFLTAILSVSIDIFFPRLTLLITTRTVSYFKSEPTKLRLLIAHELSHVKHHDPIKKIFWTTYRRISQGYLFFAGIFTIIGFLQYPQIAGWGIGFSISLVCWYIGVSQVKKLIPLLQELRADLEAIKSFFDCDALLDLLQEIPVESKFDSVWAEHGFWKGTVTTFKNGKDIMKIEEQRNQIKHRIDMLADGNVSLISGKEFGRKLLFSYGSALISLIILLVLMRQAVMIS